MVVKIKALRPVVMAVMKHLTHIEDKYLKVLVSSYNTQTKIFQ